MSNIRYAVSIMHDLYILVGPGLLRMPHNFEHNRSVKASSITLIGKI